MWELLLNLLEITANAPLNHTLLFQTKDMLDNVIPQIRRKTKTKTAGHDWQDLIIDLFSFAEIDLELNKQNLFCS